MAENATCPCGGLPQGATYSECCEPFVADGEVPTTCEQLMRSRYSAFVVRDADHLWRTWHPRTRPAEIGELVGAWLGLDVMEAVEGGPNDTHGVVEFRARHRNSAGDVSALHERSRFERRGGRWFYVDGDELP